MSSNGYNHKSDFAYSFSIKGNSKGQFYIGHVTVRSDMAKGLDLMQATYTVAILKALKDKGLQVIGLNDNKD